MTLCWKFGNSSSSQLPPPNSWDLCCRQCPAGYVVALWFLNMPKNHQKQENARPLKLDHLPKYHSKKTSFNPTTYSILLTPTYRYPGIILCACQMPPSSPELQGSTSSFTGTTQQLILRAVNFPLIHWREKPCPYCISESWRKDGKWRVWKMHVPFQRAFQMLLPSRNQTDQAYVHCKCVKRTTKGSLYVRARWPATRQL